MSKDVKTQSVSKPVGNLLPGKVQGIASASIPRNGSAEKSDDKDYVVIKRPSSPPPPSRRKVVFSTKSPSLPLDFIQELGEAIDKSTAFSTSVKQRYLAQLVDSASRSLTGGTGASSTASYRRNYLYLGATRFGCWYGTGATGLVTSTGSIYNIASFPASNATPVATFNLTDLVYGDDWGDLDAAATMVRVRKFKINLHMYPDNTPIAKAVSQTYPMPYDISKLRYRVMVVRDRFGKLGASNGAITASLSEFGGAIQQTPQNFNAILYYGSFEAAPQTDPGKDVIGATAAMVVPHSALSSPARYEILYDKTHLVAEQFWDPIGSFAAGFWRGSVTEHIDIPCDIPVAYPPNGTPGATAYPLFNACTLLIWSNFSTQQYWTYGVGAAAAAREICSPACDANTITEFETVYADDG